MKEMVKYGAILGIICLLASGVLAGVNAVTQPKILEQKNAQEIAALKDVFPEAARFNSVCNDTGCFYQAFNANDKLTGFVIKAQAQGYSSVIESVASLDLNLKLIGVKILSQGETPGVGTRIQDPQFLEQFKGKGLPEYDSVQAITGATISSSAVMNAVKKKMSELEPIFKKELSYGR